MLGSQGAGSPQTAVVSGGASGAVTPLPFACGRGRGGLPRCARVCVPTFGQEANLAFISKGLGSQGS